MQPAEPSLLPPTLARFLALWETRRGGRRMPSRRDFSHEDLWPWMGQLNLVRVENEDGRDGRFLVFSETSVRVYGREMTGRTMREFVPAPLAEAAVDAHLKLMAGGGVPMFMRVVGPFENRELEWTRLATPAVGRRPADRPLFRRAALRRSPVRGAQRHPAPAAGAAGLNRPTRRSACATRPRSAW